jgi:micrococcal nuclease
MHTYKAIVLKVIDGDTFTAKVDLGFYLVMENDHFRFRILGLQAPEIKGKTRAEGLRAKYFLRDMIEGKEVIISTEKTDNFGRWLATVDFQGTDITQLMISEGYGVPYNP